MPFLAITNWYDGDQERAYLFFEKLGLSREKMDHLHERFDLETTERFWNQAEAESGNTYVGLDIGRKYGMASTGMLGFLNQVSPSLRTVYRQIVQFQDLYAAPGHLRCVNFLEQHDFCMFEMAYTDWIREHYPKTNRQGIDSLLAHHLYGSRELVRRPICPAKVELSWPESLDRARYETFFSAPVQLGCTSNRVFWRLRDVDRILPMYNAGLQVHFKNTIEQFLSGQSQAAFTQQVRTLILRKLHHFEPLNAAVIAAEMNLTVRSLQRRMEAEQHSFQKIMDETRMELAIQLLKKNAYTINEVAYATGYEEPASFRRAFKKWTGKNPGGYVKS